MNLTEQAPPRVRANTRVVKAPPLADPIDFAGALAALTGDEPVLDGVEGLAGRNDNWKVPTAAGGALFVKRLRGTPTQVSTRLQRLVAFETALERHAADALRAVPLRGVDTDRALAVFDWIETSRTTADLLADGDFTPELARSLGRVVGEIHQLPRVEVPIEEPTGPRSATGFYALTPDDYANCSGGEAEAWAMLQHDGELVGALERLRLRSADAPTRAVHGDLRLDQFLVADPDVYVIDWEEFRYGDPAGDVGAVIGQFLHHAAARTFTELDIEVGLAPGAAHDAIMAAGEEQLTRIRRHIEEFWAGYVEIATPDPDLAVRATGYAGWHFFDRLLATALHGAKLGAAERGLAGVGRNALTQPEHFASAFGLRQD